MTDEDRDVLAMAAAFAKADAYQLRLTLPQATWHPILGELQPGVNYRSITDERQRAALEALVTSGTLEVIREPLAFDVDQGYDWGRL